MKFISALILLTLSLYSIEEEDTSYSLILKNVNKELVRKAFLNLPKRTDINILKMCNLMNQEKESLGLNDYEAVYLIYYWIGKSIRINCYSKDYEYTSAVTAYNEGTSSYVGISSLFSTMVNNIGLVSNIINGVFKSIEDNTSNGEIVETIHHVWNYVLIQKNYYLFDPTYGIGRCDYTSFVPDFTDYYFGTDPKKLIRSHFPDESKWQFMTPAASENDFNSWPYVGKYFFLNGFETISPDTKEIKISSNLEITLTFNKSRQLEKLCRKSVFDGGRFIDYDLDNCVLSDGVFKATFSGSEKMDYFIMYAKPIEEYGPKKTILIYKVK